MIGNTDTHKRSKLLLLIALPVFLVLMAMIVFADLPAGSITVYGLNGTGVTGSRNVFLNLTYGAADGIGVCRWANDASVNLASQPWEVCTTVKAWILSAGYGTKRVFYEIQDLAGHTNFFSGGITYQYLQDYTPPTQLTVKDGISGDDIDWWNSNKTISAHWSAQEDISTVYYKYRILNNSVCSGSCAFTDVFTDTGVTINNLNLSEGRNFSFEVVAFNEGGLNTTAISNGSVIDLTKPNTPYINSSTHPIEGNAYDKTTAAFNWSATDSASGIAGYSYIIDTHPGTAPDNIMESRYWETLAEMHKGSYNQTLKVNGSAASDLAYAVFSQLAENFSIGDNIRVRVALAEQFSDFDDDMRVKIYLVKAGGEGTPISAFDMESNAISNIANLSWDVRYADNMALSRTYQFDLTVTEALNDNTDDVYIVVAGVPTDDDNRNPLAIAGTQTASLIDSSTALYICDENDVAGCNDNSATAELAITVQREDDDADWAVQYDYLADGDYYFHVKAKDNAGNWGDTAHYNAVVAATGVSSLIYSPLSGELFITNETEKNITVKVSVSGNASVHIIALHSGGGNYTSPEQVLNTSGSFENITLKVGVNTLYAVTNTSLRAVSESPRINVIIATDVQPFMNKTLRISYSGCALTDLYLCNANQGSAYLGIATENLGAVPGGGGYVQTDTTYNALKIYMTKQFDTAEIAGKLGQNIFLDQHDPMFGFDRATDNYVIRNVLRYTDIYLGGNVYATPGVYQLHIRKSGITPDGRYNITLTLE